MKKNILISFSLTIIIILLLSFLFIFKLNELSSLANSLYNNSSKILTSSKNIQINTFIINDILNKAIIFKNNQTVESLSKLIKTKENLIKIDFKILESNFYDYKHLKITYDIFNNWKSKRSNLLNELTNISYLDEYTKYTNNLNLHIKELVKKTHEKVLERKESTVININSIILILIISILLILISIISFFTLLFKNINSSNKKMKEYHHLIDQNILSAIMDKNYIITDASSALLRHLSCKLEDLKNKGEFFLYKDCKVYLQNKITNTIQSGKHWDGEISKHDCNNSLKWLHARIYPTFDENYKIISYTNIFEDISSKKEIQRISRKDALTNLYNRRYFDEVFPKQINIAKRNKTNLVFAMIDIDYFKEYNDSYGHHQGDLALKKVALVLKESLHRPDDYTFRLGGEEFGMLFNVKKSQNAINLAQDFRRDIESLQIEHKNSSVSSYLTVSIGLYLSNVNQIEDINVIYNLADKCLYKAKNNGRNQIYSQVS